MTTNKSDGSKAVDTRQLLTELRTQMPVRTLRYSEHLTIAERQAERLLQLVDQRAPAASLQWLTGLAGITVVVQPRWKMNGLSGMTTWHDGRWIIGINKGNSHARRRFTLVHEFKHLLDAPRDRVTYKSLTEPQRELVANYFAACYLMPKAWLRRAGTRGLQDPAALAGLFAVSVEAMLTRLQYLGFVDAEPDRPLASYFRIESAA